jgi:hypothetical protein
MKPAAAAPGAGGAWTDGTVPERLSQAIWRSPLVEIERDRALLRFPTIGRLLVPIDAPPIVARETGAGSAQVEWLVNGPVRALQGLLGGHFALRGSAVLVDGEALLIAGSSGAGKSALAATLMRSGYAVLADGWIFVSPGAPPTVRVSGADLALWPDTVNALGMNGAEGEMVRTGLTKRTFAGPPPPAEHIVPVHSLVLLSIGAPGGGAGAIVERRSLEVPVAMRTIATLGYLSQAVAPLGLSVDHARWLMALVSLRPVELSRRGGGMAESLTTLAQAALET